MERFELDPSRLTRALSERLAGAVSNLVPTSLGESSRETPWRIDFRLDGSAQTVLLRYGRGCSRNEVVALRAMEAMVIPTPKVLIWDETGAALGIPLFVSEFIVGEPLLSPMKAGEAWAVDLYIETACKLQAISAEDLPRGTASQLEVGESAAEVLADAYDMMAEKDALVKAVYRKLVDTQPDLPDPQFSNGDLWPENLLVRSRELVGVIDWQHAGFSDPLFEFLLPFFLVPELRNLGIEERYCEQKGLSPNILRWYHGLEFFDSLRWVLKVGKPYEMHTAESLRMDLERWLAAS